MNQSMVSIDSRIPQALQYEMKESSLQNSLRTRSFEQKMLNSSETFHRACQVPIIFRSQKQRSVLWSTNNL